MIAVGYKFEGLDKLKGQLLTFSDREKVAVINALKKCTKPLEDCMKMLCPVSETGVSGEKIAKRNHPPGYLRASIGTIVSLGPTYPTVWVRPRFTGSLDPWYEHFPMAGTENYTVAPRPFVDEAWGMYGDVVEDSLKNYLEKNIQAEIDRL
jgi:hypothetical protein